MRRLALLFLAASLVGCVTTQTMPLAPNVVRIDTKAGGWLYAGKAVPATMTAAAKETLARGYSHFKLSAPEMGQGSEVAGVTGVGGRGWASASVDRVHVESSAATVTMFHADEPGAKDAFDAAQTLAQYQGQAN
ncbi:MAG: hypothetical protein ACR652_00350 [Methylocystis sp.]|uniref:hypothetical protein n=1 Tax=Methylocystis sp. TaxID=1911079 RepID=UPI003DA379DF